LASADDADNLMLRAGAGAYVKIRGGDDRRLGIGSAGQGEQRAGAAAETRNLLCIVSLRDLVPRAKNGVEIDQFQLNNALV